MPNNLPAHDVYVVEDKGDGEGYWNRIGAAWPNKDGEGFSIRLNGKLQMRKRKPKAETADDPGNP